MNKKKEDKAMPLLSYTGMSKDSPTALSPKAVLLPTPEGLILLS